MTDDRYAMIKGKPFPRAAKEIFATALGIRHEDVDGALLAAGGIEVHFRTGERRMVATFAQAALRDE